MKQITFTITFPFTCFEIERYIARYYYENWQNLPNKGEIIRYINSSIYYHGSDSSINDNDHIRQLFTKIEIVSHSQKLFPELY